MDFKKNPQCKTCELSLFSVLLGILGQETESYEKLFPRSKGGAKKYMNFLLKKKQNKTNIVKHQRLLPFTKNSHLKLMILVLFYVWEKARIWGL